jgi:hypothetical protein
MCPLDRRLHVRLALTIAVPTIATTAAGQVNVEPLRDEVGDNQLGGRAQLTFSGRVGNTQGMTLGSSGILGGRTGRHFGFVAASGDYQRSSGATDVEKYFAHARYNLHVVDPLIWEVFAQAEHDRFQRLSLRELLGTGPRFELIDDETVSLAVATAYMLELEALTAEDPYPEEDKISHRSSSYATLLIAPDDRVSFEIVCFYQPRFDDPRDFRFSSTTTMEFSIVSILTAQIGTTSRYDSHPPGGVGRFDLEVKNALGVKF